jgi:beta-barrel assembly-enhancing protease
MEGSPNAFALPGGAICMTKGMLELLESEAEIVAILSHEIGHIERGHLFDAYRTELLQRKVAEGSLYPLTTGLFDVILHLTFSKSQEDEADEFGFRMLLTKGYDPFAMSRSLETLSHTHSPDSTDPFSEFFKSHPHTELRSEKFRSRALLWTANFPNQIFYNGKRNWAMKKPFFELAFPDEWKLVGEL